MRNISPMSDSTATLLVTCPDRPGLVAGVAQFLMGCNANILHADQHIDHEKNLFLQRIQFTAPDGEIETVRDQFPVVANRFEMTWSLRTPQTKMRVGILTSRESHCLADLLSRWAIDEMKSSELVFVASNHPDHKVLADHYGIPFHHVPVDAADPERHPKAIRELCDAREIDLLVLARYMQIIPESMVDAYKTQIINIHHSFLPAFAGARPYHQAHTRGVKLIGATAHYVTTELDEGPIIVQDVVRVSHRDGIPELRQKGRDLEKVVLAHAVRLHLEGKVLAYGNRTAVFD
jgi:formyltetrahydrofolate deformylase